MPFYKELGNQGVKAKDIPVVAFSVGEEELAGVDTKPLLGHLAAWNYFQSINTPVNKEFIAKWKAFIKNPKRVTNDPMEAHVIGFAMWVEGGEEGRNHRSRQGDRRSAGHQGAEPDRRHVGNAAQPSHHQAGLHRRGARRRPVRRGVEDARPRSRATPGRRSLPGSKDLIGDWVKLKCGNYNTKTQQVRRLT